MQLICRAVVGGQPGSWWLCSAVAAALVHASSEMARDHSFKMFKLW